MNLYKLLLIFFMLANSVAYGQTLRCPDKVFNEQELLKIVREARLKRPDLPRPFTKYETKIVRERCLYRVREKALPRSKGARQTFIIDPYGEVMNVIKISR